MNVKIGGKDLSSFGVQVFSVKRTFSLFTRSPKETVLISFTMPSFTDVQDLVVSVNDKKTVEVVYDNGYTFVGNVLRFSYSADEPVSFSIFASCSAGMIYLPYATFILKGGEDLSETLISNLSSVKPQDVSLNIPQTGTTIPETTTFTGNVLSFLHFCRSLVLPADAKPPVFFSFGSTFHFVFLSPLSSSSFQLRIPRTEGSIKVVFYPFTDFISPMTQILSGGGTATIPFKQPGKGQIMISPFDEGEENILVASSVSGPVLRSRRNAVVHYNVSCPPGNYEEISKLTTSPLASVTLSPEICPQEFSGTFITTFFEEIVTPTVTNFRFQFTAESLI